MSETAIVKPDVSALHGTLAQLKAGCETLVVKDRDSCLVAKQGQRDVRALMKDIHSKLDPFVEAAKRNLQVARDELARWIDPAQKIDDALARKVKDYETQERLAAEAEQRKVNEERRRKAEAEAKARQEAAEAEAERQRKEREKQIKAQQAAGELNARETEKQRKQAAVDAAVAKQRADEEAKASVAAVQDVIVKPDIPTVAGVPSRQNWKFRIVDAEKIPRAYLIPDEVRIGQLVRSLKSKIGAETLVPGIEVWRE